MALRLRGRGSSSTSSGGGGNDVLLYAFDRLNTSGSSTDSNQLFPVLCKRGAVPAGSTLIITDASDVDVPAGICNRVYYDDGSLKMAHVALRGTVSGSGTQSLKAKKRPASSYDDTDPGTNLTTLIATGDWKVEYSSVTETDDAGSRTHGAGAMLATLAAANQAGRVRKLIANPFIERWQLWAYAKDGSDGSGSADAHLKTYWYVTRWRNSNGTQNSLFITAVSAQEEVAVADKKRLNYTATFKNGSTTLETYSSIQHPYRSTWATVRQDDDAIHARAKCVDGTDCWLIVRPDKDYWADCEAFFPFDTGLTPDAESLTADNSTFTACSSQGHRPDIDSGGDYMGRGVMPQCDARSFLSPTANHMRIARVCAHAGLHVPYHYRPPYGSSDPATLLPLILDNDSGAGSANEWNADGLPNAIRVSADPRPCSFTNPMEFPEGGDGVWAPSGDTSHAVAYSGFQWLIEGEEYFNQANLDLMLNGTIQLVGDEYGSTRALMNSGVGGGSAGYAGLGIPTTRWSSVTSLSLQERNLGWSLALIHWAGFAPAGRIESNFIADYIAHQARYIELSVSYMPANQKANGWWMIREDGIGSPWMETFGSIFSVVAKRSLGHQGFVDLAAMMGNFTAGMWSRDNRCYINAYRGWPLKKVSEGYDASDNQFNDPEHNLILIQATYDTTADTITTGDFGTDSPQALKANDKVYFATLDPGAVSRTPPGNTAIDTEYFVVNLSNPTSTTTQFQISTTQGGSVRDLTGGNGTCAVMCDLLSADAGSGGATNPGGNGYQKISYAALIMHRIDGHAAVNDALVDSAEDYLSSISFTAEPRWALKRAA